MFSCEICKFFKNTYFKDYPWTTASGCRIDNHVEIELQRRDLLSLTSLVHINISVARIFPFNYLGFFIDICFRFEETNLTKGKVYRELLPVLKYNFKERDWIFRLRRQIWSCGICRLKFSTYWVILTMTKTGYNIRNSKYDLHLHNFREV